MKLSSYNKLIAHYGLDWLTQQLIPMVSDARKALIDTLLSQRLTQLTLALECPYDLFNASAVIRSAECFGIDTVNIIHPALQAKVNRNILRGAEQWVIRRDFLDVDAFFNHAQAQGFSIAGAALAATESIDSLPTSGKLCILLGNEHAGLSDHAQQRCDHLFKIPMYGVTESLNLSVSAAISLQTLGEKIRQQHTDPGLSNEEKTYRRTLFYGRSVNGRIIAQWLREMRQTV